MGASCTLAASLENLIDDQAARGARLRSVTAIKPNAATIPIALTGLDWSLAEHATPPPWTLPSSEVATITTPESVEAGTDASARAGAAASATEVEASLVTGRPASTTEAPESTAGTPESDIGIPESGAPASGVTTGFVPQTPELLQEPERQTVAALPCVHGPVPSANPHALSLVSHTPETQINVAAAIEHLPSSTGEVCAGSVGSGRSFGSLGLHVAVESLHQPPLQSLSLAHAPAARHVPAALHNPLLHTVAALVEVQVPAPLLRPQEPSTSHTALWHAAAAVPAVQAAWPLTRPH